MPARKPKPKAKFHFSPTENHRWLMDHTPLRLAYRGGDVKAWQTKLRGKLRQLLGPMPPAGRRVPLNVRRLWTRKHDLGTIEKIVFTAEPKADVPAYVCLPRSAQPPYTWFICVQGHSTGMHNSIAVDLETNRKPIEVAGDREFGLVAMRYGVAALCIEQRAFGEREERVLARKGGNRCHDATMHALMLGRTMIGERVFDVDRGIDYLLTRDDVDRRRIGVMGNSGGGTVTVFGAAILPRISFAMPSCYFCTFRDSIMSIGHCMDNYVPNLLQYAEMSDVLGLAAPRPVVVVAGKTDTIFPVGATRKEFRKLKRIYAAAGAPDACKLVVGPEGHRFYADLAWPEMLRRIQRSRAD